jgi:hypothetical protein
MPQSARIKVRQPKRFPSQSAVAKKQFRPDCRAGGKQAGEASVLFRGDGAWRCAEHAAVFTAELGGAVVADVGDVAGLGEEAGASGPAAD